LALAGIEFGADFSLPAVDVRFNRAQEMLKRKRHTDTEIIAKLEQAKSLATQGKVQDEIARTLGISVMTLHRWRKAQFPLAQMQPTFTASSGALAGLPGELSPEEQSRIADLHLENARLRKLVTDLLLEKMKFEDEAQRSRRAPHREKVAR
jgi:hypothetical protein